MQIIDTAPAVTGAIHPLSSLSDPLRLAVAGYLARFKGQSGVHTESDLRCYLLWCEDQRLDPLDASRAHLELYLQWMQEVRGFRPSTVSRRLPVVAGFYRTCGIDGVLEQSPAEYVRRPTVPPESPTLGLTHLQFEAMLHAARLSTNPNDFRLGRRAPRSSLSAIESVATSSVRYSSRQSPPRRAWSQRRPRVN